MLFATTLTITGGTPKMSGVFDLDSVCSYIEYNMEDPDKKVGLFVSDGKQPFNWCKINEPHVLIRTDGEDIVFCDGNGVILATLKNTDEDEPDIFIGDEQTYGNPLSVDKCTKFILSSICRPEDFL